VEELKPSLSSTTQGDFRRKDEAYATLVRHWHGQENESRHRDTPSGVQNNHEAVTIHGAKLYSGPAQLILTSSFDFGNTIYSFPSPVSSAYALAAKIGPSTRRAGTVCESPSMAPLGSSMLALVD